VKHFRSLAPDIRFDLGVHGLHPWRMPEISRFFGIVIAKYYSDHAPPHFHAHYGEYEIKVGIESGKVLDGDMPERAKRRILEWWMLHRVELAEDWKLAQERRPLNSIEPLK